MSVDVRIAGLRFQRGARTVLDIPELILAASSTTALLGPNGSGKTTLLRLIGGLERPSSGTITAGGMPITPTRAARLLSAFAFQENVVLSGTVASNIEVGLRVRGIPSTERAARVESAGAAAGVSHLLPRDARKLSGGEARRVSLARALALRAPITLLDEPLAGLDAATRAQLLDDLPGMLAGSESTTILVTHDRDEAFRVAQDIAVMVEGRLLAHGSAGAVFRAPPSAEVARLLGYMVLATPPGDIGVPPGGFALGPGPFAAAFEATVASVTDLGSSIDVRVEIDGVTAGCSLPPGCAAPAPGSRVKVGARQFVTFD